MAKTRIVKQLRHGQITIPKEFREALGLSDEDLLSITLEEGKLEVAPVKVSARGLSWAKDLYEIFAPVRESVRREKEEEIDQAIEEAVREARADKQ